MPNKVIEFGIGAAIPLVASVFWFGVIRKMVSRETATRLYQTSPYKYVTPMVLVFLCIMLAVGTWSSHRWTAYAALMWVGIASLMSLAVVMKSGRV